MFWTVYGRDGTNPYSFLYDEFDRLTKAYYPGEEAGEENPFGVDITYDDLLGNISSIQRRGLIGFDQNGDKEIGLMDNLTMTIFGGKLTDVTESANVDYGYKGQGSGFAYDDGGRLLSAAGRGILEISYFDKVEMPSQILTDDGSIEFYYDAEGRKWGQKTTFLNPPQNAPAVEEKIYINGLEIVNDQLSAFNHEYGRLVFDAEGVPSHEEYFIADHLGNVRVYFADLDGNGEVERNDEEVFQAKSYYPFVQDVTCHSHVALARPNPDQLSVGRMEIEGFEHHDYSLPRQPYSYNGKEKLLGGLLDYGARLMDPAMPARLKLREGGGRFLSVDPLASDFVYWNPYVYVKDNPLINIDPTGMASDVCDNCPDEESYQKYIDDKYEWTYVGQNTVMKDGTDEREYVHEASSAVSTSVNSMTIADIYDLLKDDEVSDGGSNNNVWDRSGGYYYTREGATGDTDGGREGGKNWQIGKYESSNF